MNAEQRGGEQWRSPEARAPHNAGVIGDALVATRLALFDMAAEPGGTTPLDRGHHAPLGRRQRGTGGGTIGLAVAAEDIRHLQRRTGHERVSLGRRGGRVGWWHRTGEELEWAGGRTDLGRGDA
jgi:hypothetical protein